MLTIWRHLFPSVAQETPASALHFYTVITLFTPFPGEAFPKGAEGAHMITRLLAAQLNNAEISVIQTCSAWANRDLFSERSKEACLKKKNAPLDSLQNMGLAVKCPSFEPGVVGTGREDAQYSAQVWILSFQKGRLGGFHRILRNRIPF